MPKKFGGGQVIQPVRIRVPRTPTRSTRRGWVDPAPRFANVGGRMVRGGGSARRGIGRGLVV